MKTLTVVLAKKDTRIWLSGEPSRKFPATKREFDIDIEGKLSHVEIKSLGKTKKEIKGWDIDWDANVSDLITPEILQDYAGEVFPVPNITVKDLRDKMVTLVKTKPANKFTKDEWHLSYLQEIFSLYPEFYKYKPRFVETLIYEGYDCPLNYRSKTIQAFIVRKNEDSCMYPKDSILIAWHIPDKKRKELTGRRAEFEDRMTERLIRHSVRRTRGG